MRRCIIGLYIPLHTIQRYAASALLSYHLPSYRRVGLSLLLWTHHSVSVAVLSRTTVAKANVAHLVAPPVAELCHAQLLPLLLLIILAHIAHRVASVVAHRVATRRNLHLLPFWLPLVSLSPTQLLLLLLFIALLQLSCVVGSCFSCDPCCQTLSHTAVTSVTTVASLVLLEFQHTIRYCCCINDTCCFSFCSSCSSRLLRTASAYAITGASLVAPHDARRCHAQLLH